MEEKIATLLQGEVDAMQRLPIRESIPRTLDLCHDHVHDPYAKIVVSGMGKVVQNRLDQLATVALGTCQSMLPLHQLEGILQCITKIRRALHE